MDSAREVYFTTILAELDLNTMGDALQNVWLLRLMDWMTVLGLDISPLELCPIPEPLFNYVHFMLS